MSSTIRSLFLLIVFTSAAFSQEIGRELKIQNIFDLRSQITALEKEILQPDAKDTTLAQKQGFNVMRLLPREKYDSVLAMRGGGAYYSFVLKTHEYGHGSDIELSQGYLSVGFAGADYGFLIDLGEIGLEDVSKDSAEMDFLLKYIPPTDEPAIRAEFRMLQKNYEANGVSFKSRIPAVVGHCFALRSISISDSDILIVFKVQRKDSDGSIILLWKPVETFPKPLMRRENEASVR